MALEAALAALAATGGSALVAAMATDAWNSIRAGFARLLGSGEPTRVAALEDRLEAARAELERMEGADLLRARADQESLWRGELADLLTGQPHVAESLTELLNRVRASLQSESSTPVTQYAVASGDAQQVVQGHGIQSITFSTRER
jgi:hypothetical protein